jgi:hypothetical protein
MVKAAQNDGLRTAIQLTAQCTYSKIYLTKEWMMIKPVGCQLGRPCSKQCVFCHHAHAEK